MIESCAGADYGKLPLITITWSNGDAYDSLVLLRNGSRVAELPGDVTSYEDSELEGPGTYTYRIIAESLRESCIKSSSECTVLVSLYSTCSLPESPIETNATLNALEYSLPFVDPDCGPFDPDRFPIVGHRVFVDLEHESAASCDVTITSPEGTAVTLLNSEVSQLEDADRVTVSFASEGEALSWSTATCGCATTPDGPGSIGDFLGEDPTGDWTLETSTTSALSAGTLSEWCVGVFVQGPTSVPSVSVPRFKRGDCDNNGSTFALLDGLFLLAYVFTGGTNPGCLVACDVDNDGTISALVDGIYLLQWMFQGGPVPPDPGPWYCGSDPEAGFYIGCGQEVPPADSCDTESRSCD